MKVLYLASNPEDSNSLSLEREITELQSRFSNVSGEPVVFTFLPDIKIEDLQSVMSRYRPDVLHISAHADLESLSLKNDAGNLVELNADALKHFIDHEAIPRIVYLNACNSAPVAEELSKLVPISIGTSSPITNRAARSGAVSFYTKLLEGKTVQSAYESSNASIKVLQHGETHSKIYCRSGVDPTVIIMHQIPRIVARFKGDDICVDKKGMYKFEIGMLGCPNSTRQLVIFTGDQTFVKDGSSLTSDMCSISLEMPLKGELWIDETWWSSGDFVLHGCGVTSDYQHFVTCSAICDALEAYYKLKFRDPTLSKTPKRIIQAIKNLRQMDGSELWAHISDQQKATGSRGLRSRR